MKRLQQFFLLLLIFLIVGCGEYEDGEYEDDGLIFSDGGKQTQNNTVVGRRPPPTRPAASNASGEGNKRNTVQVGEGEETVNFGLKDVSISPVWLEYNEEFDVLRVATSLPPTRGTLFVLLREDQWGRKEDLFPFEQNWIVLTIHRHSHASAWSRPNRWVRGATVFTVEPLELLEEMRLPSGTVENFIIEKGHAFVSYEPDEKHKTVTLMP